MGEEGAKEEVELKIRRLYRGAAMPECLPRPKDVRDPISGQPYGRSEDDAAALTDMRQRIIAESHALICLGGMVVGYTGRYPSVLEETALSLSEGWPVYLLGGFGGAAADAARELVGMGPVDPKMRQLKENCAPG